MAPFSPSASALLGLVSVLALGCGASDSKATAPEATAGAATSAIASTSSAPTATAHAPTSASAGAASGAPVTFPKWAKFPGPKGHFALSAALAHPTDDSVQHLWAVRPSQIQWDTLSFTLGELERADGDDFVVKTAIFPEHGYPGDEHLTVPGAMVCEPSTNAKLKKGDVVLLPMAATTSDYARIIGPEKDTPGAFRVATHWVSADETVTSPGSLLLIEDKPTCGQRVWFKNASGDELRWMQLVRVAGDKAWGIGFEEGKYDSVLVSVPAKDITPMPMTKTYAPKAKVMVATGNHTLDAAQITEVKDKGLAYHVKFDGGNESDFDFEDVTDPIPGWPKK